MTNPEISPCVAALGNFDGVHLGHIAILREASALGKELGVPVLVWSFAPLPGGRELTDPVLRAAWLRHYGADRVIYDTFGRVRGFSPEEFLDKILIGSLGAVGLVCGFNYRFGKDRAGDAGTLRSMGAARGISVRVVPEVRSTLGGEDTTVCSTLIRSLIREGRLEEAQALLSHPFVVRGKIVSGKALGRTLGFPTANQLPEERTVLPPKGVYAAFCAVEGTLYPAVTNIGSRPTVDDGDHITAETNILGFSGDLYGRDLPVGYLCRLRDEKRFPSLDALRLQMEADRRNALSVYEKRKEELFLPSFASSFSQ